MVTILHTKPGSDGLINEENKGKTCSPYSGTVLNVFIQYYSDDEREENGKPKKKAACIKAVTKVRKFANNPLLQSLYNDYLASQEDFPYALYHYGNDFAESITSGVETDNWNNFRVERYREKKFGYMGPITRYSQTLELKRIRVTGPSLENTFFWKRSTIKEGSKVMTER